MYEMQCNTEWKLYRIHNVHDQEILNRKSESDEEW